MVMKALTSTHVTYNKENENNLSGPFVLKGGNYFQKCQILPYHIPPEQLTDDYNNGN